MFRVTEEGNIQVTRGDAFWLNLTMADDEGVAQSFRSGDRIRMKVFEQNNCARVVLQKDFPVGEGDATEQQYASMSLYLSGEDTTIGRLISKPTEYWYEIELNPRTEQDPLADPRTIVGYDENGPKIFLLYPEGNTAGKDV